MLNCIVYKSEDEIQLARKMKINILAINSIDTRRICVTYSHGHIPGTCESQSIDSHPFSID
jgi:hypothetical protein